MRVLVPDHIRRLADRGTHLHRVPGAMLVVDIEGSTPLSARLRRHGTTGAEALADVLTAVFGSMVDEVTREGGVVVDLAGDGIVAAFEGEADAVSRCTRAAVRIMAELERSGDYATPDGPASVQVRAVIGYGTIEYRIWTIERLDLQQSAAYACFGSALEEAQRGEAFTPGGMLTIGPSATHHLPPTMRARPFRDGYIALTELGIEPSSRGEMPALTGTPEGGRHRFFPDEIVDARRRGEFRDVVACFVEFREMPSVAPGSPVSRMLELLAERGGYLCNVVTAGPDRPGPRALALWGAPTSQENDVGHALRFIWDLRSGDRTADVRAGLTFGSAFAGFVGGPSLESYTAVGSTINLAARMCDGADWGEIRIDGAIASMLDEAWAVEDLGAIEYRGFDDEVPTHRVGFVPPVRTAERFHGAFVGRRSELDGLEDLLAPLWTGRPAGVIAVTGEAGVGKSRFLETARVRLSEHDPAPVWLEARAEKIRTQPLATLRNALSAYFGRSGAVDSGDRLHTYVDSLKASAPHLGTELDRGRSALGDLLGNPADRDLASALDPRARFDNLVLAVQSLVAAIETNAPVIVSIADGQWIDSGTVDILERMVRALDDARLAIIVESRSVHPDLQPDHTIELGPLSRDEVAELAERLLGPAATDEVISAVVVRSAGNAFFARQLLEYTIGGHDPGASDVELPSDLRRLLIARLDELSPTTRSAVQTASILGRRVDLAVLETMVSPGGGLEGITREAVDAGIWRHVDEHHVEFRSLLFRDAAQGMVLHGDQQSLHLTAATAIESVRGSDERTVAELAFHYDRGGRPDEAAARYADAGRFAADRFATSEAVGHFTRASDLLVGADVNERFEVLASMYDVLDVAGDREEQRSVLDVMDELGDLTPPTSVRRSILRARWHIAVGSYEVAETILTKVPTETADTAVAAERGSVEFLQAQVARYRGRTDEALRLASVARESFEREGDPIAAATVDDFAGGIAWERGDVDAAIALHQSAAEVFHAADRAVQEIRALNNLGSALFAKGDYSAARAIHMDGARRSHEIGFRMGEGDHLDNVGGTAWAVGDYELAIERYTQALEIRQGMADAWGVAISKGNLGATYRALDRPSEGLELYREALEIDEDIGRRRGEAYDLHGIGLCLIDLSRYNLAVEALTEAARIRRGLGESHLARESDVACAVAMSRRGDAEPALALVTEALDAEGDEPFEGAIETIASIRRCLEVLGSHEPDRADSLRRGLGSRIADRAARISDPDQRASYLHNVESHRTAEDPPGTPGS